ncbi:MAG: N(4)-(beta-N-acetylglucosaminyl)-L-asparaginase [Pseudomonadota bacterium]|nr:N(4)-(beta-N-acetylglucosaminyl)-L-asparaginase [Pseudomonadota bacterium]MED5386354.1 N(4)-(beta-N-acetylglucosaminyl)-L-asparaginase [Pseudomonadota bacterium]MEE3300559.1 N(4)-(beta-N-acetylglucosaminyl)-L-asparaginase [Pseudomonadota bacterium]|tara:strand:+ start:252 stop:1448 length:1197 start_codon:yes stop_codon:yes gene_type:complete
MLKQQHKDRIARGDYMIDKKSPSAINRRTFIGVTSAIGAMAASGAGPAIAQSSSSRPVVISSGNGFVHRNGGTETCVERAYRMITEGTDVLESLIAGVNIVELDPEDASVGYGGLPDAWGRVTLDSCCMHGPLKRAGGVAALQGVRTPSNVAKAVADLTDHHLLVAQGAQDFARQMGFSIEEDLNTERSRQRYLEWRRRIDPSHYPDPNRQAQLTPDAYRQFARESIQVAEDMAAEGLIDPEHLYGTINCNGVNNNGDVCGVTTTSGLAWKIPGRVGDSPILGAGLYVSNDHGAAGSTGRGEANLYNLASFLVVEELRRGADPKDAGMTALQRIWENTETRLLNENREPTFNVNFYVLGKDGRHAGVAFYGASSGNQRNYAVCDENGGRHEPIEGLIR